MLSNYYVYIVTNASKTTLYTGVTINIQRRLSEHDLDSTTSKKSFAGKYNCVNLVYYEGFQSVVKAILREKEIKKCRREKKNRLITEFNPEWEFLNNQVV